MMVPLSEPDITSAEIEAVIEVLKSSRLSLGPKLQEFEELMAESVGLPHGVAVSSGTAGLHLCVRALGIGPGDEVIVPSFTFIAAANVLRYEGATPVFVDIDPYSLNLDPSCVEAAITSRTRAIMAVHTFGVPAPMDRIVHLARQHGLLVIEDACEAIGASFAGQPVGSFGDAAVFAFYPNKQITTGEGGMVVTRNADLADTLRALRNQGRFPGDEWHQHRVLGFNYRLSEIGAALGVVQMRRLGEILEKRAAAAGRYDRLFSNMTEVSLPTRAVKPHRMSWFVYVIRLARDRDGVAKRITAEGIQCGRYFAPVHEQQAYAQWPVRHALPVTEAESRRTLALPFFSNISDEQIAYVVGRVRAALER